MADSKLNYRSLALGLALGASCLAAQAQRAALVQEVYGPGRTPYRGTQLYNQDASVCFNNFGCQINFPQVPAGKRLVVTYASAFYTVASGQSGAYVLVGTDLSNFAHLPPPMQTYPGAYVAAGPVTYYFEPGEIPSVFIGASNGIMTGYTGHAAMVGYLVPAP